MFTHLVGLGKLWILIYRRDKIDSVKKKLQDVQYRYEPLDDFQPGQLLRREKFFSIFIAGFIFILYTFVGASAHISAAVMIGKNTMGETFTGNSSCESFTPYYFYYPFDVSTTTGCYYMLTYMHICLDVFAWYIASLDMVFVTLLHLLSTQLKIVGDALTTIRKRCLHRLQMKQDFVCLYDPYSPILEQELYKEITHCTKHLYLLIDVRMDIEETFSFITLVQTVASLLIFASCLFVAAQGEAIPSAMYKIDWFSASPRFKKSMIMTMARMQRPLFVSIGKFTPLALTTLLAVVKGSFSYFTVFQSAGGE
ncbi:unnamed protein product [Ceutorhynchus assimilis]|uniref:Odorant receptor n=1 Tax=Ceutorhynchus assimilis TaxID=467358 RepID=A0A9N9MNC9_9CUCU|nr:unnamed protein product [Ceutorhynchus assimilis]